MFPSTFSNVVLQNAHQNTFMETRLLNACNLRALRLHFNKKWHDCAKDIAMISGTLHSVQIEGQTNNSHKRRHLLWRRAYLRWTDRKWKSVHIMDGIHGRCVLQGKFTLYKPCQLFCNLGCINHKLSLFRYNNDKVIKFYYDQQISCVYSRRAAISKKIDFIN